VVLYELLTGELPVGKFGLPSKLVQVHVRIDDVVLKALERDPEQRYQRASQMGTDVGQVITGTVPPKPGPVPLNLQTVKDVARGLNPKQVERVGVYAIVNAALLLVSIFTGLIFLWVCVAVFWGMAIIGVSGYILWFRTFFSKFLPWWFFNVALLVHGEEALLAAGFIFTIHFFNSHLRPEKFPMDLVIFTGRVSEDELREERPEEYKRLMGEGKLDSIKAGPAPLWLRNFGRIIGATAVTIGLSLFVLILIAVFGR
jgi:hypothetical protein